MRTAAVGVLLLVGSSLVMGHGDEGESAAKPVSLQEIHQRGVEGRLGVKLGTIVTIKGSVVPNTSRSKADVSERFFLSIEQIDGESLDKPIQFPFRSKFDSKPLPKIGDEFSYVAYETGRFEGTPDGEFDYVQAYADIGFGFGTELLLIAETK
jgi:hypothetical protein